MLLLMVHILLLCFPIGSYSGIVTVIVIVILKLLLLNRTKFYSLSHVCMHCTAGFICEVQNLQGIMCLQI